MIASPYNIIIIGDNETFSMLVTHYLKNNLANAQVFAEVSAKKAIASIKRLKPTLVVLDYYLEDDLNAKDVMQVINEMGKDRPEVILLSSITDEKEKQEVMAMGIEQFVPKSNESFYDLVSAIEASLANRKASYGAIERRGKLSLRGWIGLIAIALLVVLAALLMPG